MPEEKEPLSYEELEAASAALQKRNVLLEQKLKMLAAPQSKKAPVRKLSPTATDRFGRTYDGR